MKIGFFGGSFNPITNIHINIAENLIINKYVDEVIIVPVGDFYIKEGLIKAIHRYNMIKLAIENHSNIYVDDVELKSNRKFYANDIFELLDNKYPDDDIYFIMGTDNYVKMPKWQKYEQIKDRYKYLVISRREDELKIDNPNVLIVKKNDEKEEIDSTFIRKKIACKEDVSSYLNDNVYQYIKENKLYLN